MYHRDDAGVVSHKGIFFRRLTEWQATALIVSGTVGAGILGIPYVVAKVGIGIGLFFIVAVGMCMIGFNLLLGEIAVRTNHPLQLSGFAKKYLGRFGEILMTIVVYSILFGVLAVYIIGAGLALAELFGGSPQYWGLVFFVLGSCGIAIGIRTVKTVEFFLTMGIFLIVMLFVLIAAPHIAFPNFVYVDLSFFLLPYGVMLFAYHGAAAIPEAHTLLAAHPLRFRRAIVRAGVMTMILYAVFALVVVGVTGIETTEIATIGLGRTVGPFMVVLGNVFAVLAMGTSFLMSGLALRDSIVWDFRIKPAVATFAVLAVPLTIFLLGLRQFIAAIDVIGGVFSGTEMLLILLIFWRAKQLGDVPPGRYHLHHAVFLWILLLVALGIGTVWSVVRLF